MKFLLPAALAALLTVTGAMAGSFPDELKTGGFVVGCQAWTFNRFTVMEAIDKTAQAGMEQPVYFWTPDIAPAGIAFYTGKLFPAWQGDLFVAELVGRTLVRLVLNGERVIAEERLLTELNARIRGVNEGPDGPCTL